MSRNIVIVTIAFFVVTVGSAADVDRPAGAGNGDLLKRPAEPSAERVYELPPGSRPVPIAIGLYCNDEDCASDRARRCADRGHGGATDHVFHLAADGTGNCLITCDDGYLLLVVEEGCQLAAGAERASFGPRQRVVWFAPDGEPCVDRHAVGTEAPVCRLDPATIEIDARR